MSMPFLVFSCSRCDFTGASTVVWGEFLYAASPEPVALERELGWCSACAGLAPVEVLPTPDRIDRLRSEIGRHHRRVEAATARARAQQPCVTNLSGIKRYLSVRNRPRLLVVARPQPHP